MQGGARKAAMAGFFFFTKNGWTGQRPPPAAHRARQAGLTILPTIPADTRAPPARQAGFMPGSDRCAATRPSRARVGPQNRATQARKPGPRPRRVRPAAQGETGAAAGRTEWESGRAPGMEERMMAGPGGGNGENGRESGRAQK